MYYGHSVVIMDLCSKMSMKIILSIGKYQTDNVIKQQSK